MQANVTMLEMSALSSLIDGIGKQKVVLDTQIQTAAAECVAQSIVHRNATPAKQLFDTVGSNMRRDALVAYFEKFGNLAWNKTDKKVVFFDVEKILGADKKLEWNEEYATKVRQATWDSMKKEPTPVSVYDAEIEFGKFIKRMERLVADPSVTVKSAEIIAKVKAAYHSAVSGLTLEGDTPTRTPEEQAVEDAIGAKKDNKATAEQLALLVATFGS